MERTQHRFDESGHGHSEPGGAPAQALGRLRVLLAEPAPQGGLSASQTLRALRSLAADTQLEIYHDAAGARAALLCSSLDLVVVDEGLGEEGVGDLIDAARQQGGPPVIVVCRQPGAEGALAAFRRGAADCVPADAPRLEVLPVLAREQVRRWRGQRARREAEDLGRRVDALQRYTENLVQNMNGALVVVDRHGRITFANPSAEKLLGAEPGGLVDCDAGERFGADGVRELIGRTLDEGRRFRGIEAVVPGPGRRQVPISLSCAPLLEADGERSGAIVIFQDLTEIKELQAQVLQADKMASIGQLAAGVAHEINNPIGFVNSNLGSLSDALGDWEQIWERVGALRAVLGELSPQPAPLRAALQALEETIARLDGDRLLAEFGDMIRDSLEGAARVRHIVSELSAFSHRDDGVRALTDVNKALDSTAHIVWTMMKGEVVLRRSYEEIPPIPAYPMQLKQIFMNLLVNAVQAVQERNQAVEGEPRRGEIQLQTAARDGGALVSVRDNGGGIPEENLERIFDPFFTTKEVGVGTGLGLSTCFHLVRRHGGTIRAHSKLGVGTTFEVWLPGDSGSFDPP